MAKVQFEVKIVMKERNNVDVTTGRVIQWGEALLEVTGHGDTTEEAFDEAISYVAQTLSLTDKPKDGEREEEA